MNEVETYISNLGLNQRKIMWKLHHLLINHPKVTTKIRYRVPFYHLKSWFCYLNPLKNDGIEMVFTRAQELSNENGLLNFRDRKQVAGVCYFSANEIDTVALNETLNEAFILDETIPYSTKRKK